MVPDVEHLRAEPPHGRDLVPRPLLLLLCHLLGPGEESARFVSYKISTCSKITCQKMEPTKSKSIRELESINPGILPDAPPYHTT